MDNVRNYVLLMKLDQIQKFFRDNKDNKYRIEFRDSETQNFIEVINFIQEHFMGANDNELYEFQVMEDYVKIALSINIYFEGTINTNTLDYEKIMPSWE